MGDVLIIYYYTPSHSKHSGLIKEFNFLQDFVCREFGSVILLLHVESAEDTCQ